MKWFPLLLCAGLVTACSDDNNPAPRVPATPGYSAYIQANLAANAQSAAIGATVFKDGRKITLVAGDAIRVSNGSQQTLLQGSVSNFGFYSGTMPVDDAALGVSFDIVHEPIETRDDRWYPADIAYVDPGPGQFVGLNWSINFPLPIIITAPTEEPAPVVYSYADDPVIIQWTSTSADVDKVRVKAVLGCLNQTAEIYSGPNTGETTITIAGIFAHANYAPITELEEFTEDIFALILDPTDIFDNNPINDHLITHCDIGLYVLGEYQNQIGPPFVAGNVVASQSDTVRIVFNPFTPLEL